MEQNTKLASELSEAQELFKSYKDYLSIAKFESLVNTAEAQLQNKDDPQIAKILLSYSEPLLRVGQNKKSREQLKRALEIVLKEQGNECNEQVAHLNYLIANTYYTKEKLDHKALEFVVKARKLYEELKQTNSGPYADALVLESSLLMSLGRVHKGLQLAEKITKIISQESKQMIGLQKALKIGYSHRNQQEKVFEHAQKCLDLSKKLYGEDSIETLQATQIWAFEMIFQKKGQEALEWIEEVIEKKKKLFTTDKHREVAESIGVSAIIKMIVNGKQVFAEINEKALEIFKEVNGEYHYDVGACYAQLARHYAGLGDMEKADGYQKLMLEVAEKYYEEEKEYHQSDIYFFWAQTKYQHQNKEKAKEYFLKALELREACNLDWDPRLIHIHFSLSELCQDSEEKKSHLTKAANEFIRAAKFDATGAYESKEFYLIFSEFLANDIVAEVINEKKELLGEFKKELEDEHEWIETIKQRVFALEAQLLISKEEIIKGIEVFGLKL